ncbi:MAG: hypothetical protein K8J08_13255 [Thermoanaerobaculia bacterium]|nr:hypothetical protein [Thermoanaerobaculia bacterium]
MLTSILEATSLPNLHPAIVHFALAFLPLALLLDLGSLVSTRFRSLQHSVTGLYGLAALGAWAAVLAGERAADGLVGVEPSIQAEIGRHSDWGHYALYAILASFALRLATLVVAKRGSTAVRLVRTLSVICGFVALATIGRAADFGGGLVFRHAVGVDPSALAGSEGEEYTESTEQTAAGTDAGAPVPESDDTEGPAPKEATPSLELPLEISGSTTILLPGTLEDLQFEARVERLDFEGTIELLYRYHSVDESNSLAVVMGETASLIQTRQGSDEVLSRDPLEDLAPEVTIAVSAAGRHLKGIVDGHTVTHGHASPGEAGSAGLRIRGTGRLRILELRIVPIGSQ